MNWIDLFILSVVVWATFRGFRTGIIRQVASLLSLLLATLFCSIFSSFVEFFLTQTFDISPQTVRLVATPLSFILIVFAIRFAGRIVERFICFSLLRLSNRILGAVVAPFFFLCLMSLFFFTIDTISPPKYSPKDNGDTSARQKSLFYHPVKEIVPHLFFFFTQYKSLSDKI